VAKKTAPVAPKAAKRKAADGGGDAAREAKRRTSEPRSAAKPKPKKEVRPGPAPGKHVPLCVARGDTPHSKSKIDTV